VPKARPTAETIAQLNPTHAPVRPSPVAVAEPTRLPPTAPPVRPPAATDQDRIQDALHLYERAQNTLDVDLYARVYAGLTPERKQQVAQAWQGLKTQELKLDCQPPKITGTTAEVACFERRVASPRVGSEQHSDINKVMHLEKRGDAWVITSMR
jgi:hypothetical protein